MSGWVKFARDLRGNTTVVFALCLPVVLGFVGLGVETAYWQFKQRQMQTAADLAAFTGAVSLRNHESPTQAGSEAEEEAVRHGFDASRGMFAAHTPPLSGPYVNARSMEIILSQSVDRFLSAMFVRDEVVVQVRAVATYQQPAAACIIALSRTATAAVDFYGSSRTSLQDCEVMSNSIADNAVLVRGSAAITVPCLNAVGGVLAASTASYTMTGCPAPRTGLPLALDPYADVAPPSIPSACSNIHGGGPPDAITTVSSGPSGVKRFCNGLNLTKDYHFEPGVYVIDGGRLRVGGQGSLAGSGVTFYLTSGASVDFNGTANIELSAPVDGPYAGLIFFGNRSDFGAQHTFNGTSDSSMTGSIYLPAGDVTFAGNYSGVNGCMQLIANTVAVGGNSSITTSCAGTGIDMAHAPSDVRLVE